MAGRPLSPAIRLRLGGPSPHLLADRTRAPLLPDCSFHLSAYAVLASVSKRCPPAKDSFSRVTHPSATRLYLKQAFYITPFDLHVLGTPPAFVLSQDQTLRLIPVLFYCYAFACILKRISRRLASLHVSLFVRLAANGSLCASSLAYTSRGALYKAFAKK